MQQVFELLEQPEDKIVCYFTDLSVIIKSLYYTYSAYQKVKVETHQASKQINVFYTKPSLSDRGSIPKHVEQVKLFTYHSLIIHDKAEHL
jgi:hypothetical protein